MKSFPIGVIIESFKKPLLECLDLTKAIGAQGLQLYATKGETAPENLTGEKRRAFLNAGISSSSSSSSSSLCS